MAWARARLGSSRRGACARVGVRGGSGCTARRGARGGRSRVEQGEEPGRAALGSRERGGEGRARGEGERRGKKKDKKKKEKRKRKDGEREKGKKREGERFAPKTRRSVGHARRRAHVSATRGSRKNRAVDLVVGVGSNRDREIGRNRESSRNIRVRF